jgi:hypothetical protein
MYIAIHSTGCVSVETDLITAGKKSVTMCPKIIRTVDSAKLSYEREISCVSKMIQPSYLA